MRFRQLVEERFREHWPVLRYAEALGVSPDRLHAVCTRVLARSPRVLIQQRILHEAVTRLERSAISIKQLAFVLGFKDTAYFNRFFRRQLGMPPGPVSPRHRTARRGAALPAAVLHVCRLAVRRRLRAQAPASQRSHRAQPSPSAEREPDHFPDADLRNSATSSRALPASTPDCFSSSS